ncbi:MAG: GNAT family protein [Lapillicoccus sp.]
MSAWPMTLVSNDGRRPTVVLRRLTRRDHDAWDAVRRDNADYVGQWEPTSPDGIGRRMTFRQYVRGLDKEAKDGRMLPFVIDIDGHIAGQMHLFGIVQGSLLSGAAGYWVARRYAGTGVATRSLALLCDHAFTTAGLHRVEVNIRPENAPSLRVVDHLRFRDEGLRARYLHIAGGWRDHRTFALTLEDLQGGSVVDRWRPGHEVPRDAVHEVRSD